MKVHELIEKLKNFDSAAEVHFAYKYGDYWHTQVAPIVETADELYVKHSDYHNMPKLIDDDEIDDDQHPVVVLQA